jgi:phosphate ABC transporter, permease protein PstA
MIMIDKILYALGAIVAIFGFSSLMGYANISHIPLLLVLISVFIFIFVGVKKRDTRLIFSSIFLLAFSFLIFMISPDLKIPLGEYAAIRGSFIISTSTIILGLFVMKSSINMRYGFDDRAKEYIAFTLIGIAVGIVLYALGVILFHIFIRGAGAMSIEFLTNFPTDLGSKGGIFPCIVGTFYLVMGAMVISVLLGIPAAIYLVEYARPGKMTRLIDIAVSSLNGVPSIVFGLFGLALFVSIFGISLLSGSIILGLMNLPTIIMTAEEALKGVPQSIREGSLALGATRWQTIRRVVLPSAIPGILTGTILAVGRAAGETAPIMWTAVVFTGGGIPHSIFEPVMALPYHLLELIYLLGYKDVEANAWGTAFVLISLVLVVNLIAIIIRDKYKKKMMW